MCQLNQINYLYFLRCATVKNVDALAVFLTQPAARHDAAFRTTWDRRAMTWQVVGGPRAPPDTAVRGVLFRTWLTWKPL